MHRWPNPGEPTLIRPSPGKQVVKDRAAGQFLPPEGGVYPWSEHWAYMAGAGAIEYPGLCPPWKTPVLIKPLAGQEAKAVDGSAVKEQGQILPWEPHWRDQLLAQRIHFPRALPEAGALVRIKGTGQEAKWEKATWSKDLEDQLLAGAIEFPEEPFPEMLKEDK